MEFSKEKLNYQPFWDVFCNDTDTECAEKQICSQAIISDWEEITSLGLETEGATRLLEQEVTRGKGRGKERKKEEQINWSEIN